MFPFSIIKINVSMKASAAHNNPCVVIMVQLFWTQASLLTCIHIFFILPHFIEKNERERESCSLIHLFPPSQRTLERRESSRTLLFIVTVAALKKKAFRRRVASTATAEIQHFHFLSIPPSVHSVPHCWCSQSWMYNSFLPRWSC